MIKVSYISLELLSSPNLYSFIKKNRGFCKSLIIIGIISFVVLTATVMLNGIKDIWDVIISILLFFNIMFLETVFLFSVYKAINKKRAIGNLVGVGACMELYRFYKHANFAESREEFYIYLKALESGRDRAWMIKNNE